MRDPNAFTLLAQIAFRARWHVGRNMQGLEVGEALIGDHRSLGMTRGQYREATKRLTKIRFATIRTTNKGTIAKLASPLVFDLTYEGQQKASRPPTLPSNNHPTTNEQPLTNKERREEGVLVRFSVDEDGITPEDIYAAYPRKAVRKEALKAIEKACRAYAPSLLLQKTREYAQARSNEDARYTPHASTWFNQERFLDDPATWVVAQPQNEQPKLAYKMVEVS